MFLMSIEKYKEYYDIVDSMDCMNKVILLGENMNPQHYLMRLK